VALVAACGEDDVEYCWTGGLRNSSPASGVPSLDEE
jgi:hypothetical protein